MVKMSLENFGVAVEYFLTEDAVWNNFIECLPGKE